MRIPFLAVRLAAVVEDMHGAEGPWGSLPDLLQPETFTVFARLGLEPYAKRVGHHFGNTIPGIFTDETKPHGRTPFTKDLFATFQQTNDYDLQPRVYQLFGDPQNEEAIRTLTLGDEQGLAWMPDPLLADGDMRRVKDGLRWQLPAMGSGFFKPKNGSSTAPQLRMMLASDC